MCTARFCLFYITLAFEDAGWTLRQLTTVSPTKGQRVKKNFEAAVVRRMFTLFLMNCSLTARSTGPATRIRSIVNIQIQSEMTAVEAFI